MKIRFTLLSMLALCVVVSATAQQHSRGGMHRHGGKQVPTEQVDTVGIVERTRRSVEAPDNFVVGIYDNPATMTHRYEFRITDISGSMERNKQDVAAVVGTGDGYRHFDFNATSFVPLNARSAVWGKAGYRNGRIFNMLWNETSDYDFVYPLIQGDSRGGKMRVERYSFAGGYATELGKWSIGAELRYRAELQYRTRDPRPENRISDLDINLGGTRRLWGKYALGIGLHIKSYKQKNPVKFASIKTVAVYQMEGLGGINQQFSGNAFMDYTLQGSVYGASLQLYPADKRGFTLYASYAHTGLDKTVNDVQRNYVTINDLAQSSAGGGIGYQSRYGSHVYGIRLGGSMRNRTVNRNIFSSSGSNNYEQIASREVFTQKTSAAEVELMWGLQQVSGWNITVLPAATFNNLEENYSDYTTRSHTNSTLQYGIKMQCSKSWAHWLVGLNVSSDYSSNMKNDFLMPTSNSTSDSATVASDKEAIRSAYLQNIERLGLDYIKAQGALRVGRTVGKRTLLYIDASYAMYRFDDKTKAHCLTASFGAMF